MSVNYGYRQGPRNPVKALLDSSTATIAVGDLLTVATTGYVKRAAAGETVRGVAMNAATAPSADGAASIEMDVSPLSIYEYPPDTGTVTQGLVGTSMDVGGPQSINIDASSVDNVLVHGVNTERNTVLVSFIFAFAGVA